MTKPHDILIDLRKIRQESRISQDAVAAATNTAQHRISYYETGRVLPRVELISAWADFLGYKLVLQPKGEE